MVGGVPWPCEKQELGWGAGFFPPQTAPCPQVPILGAKGYRSDSSFPVQDQRLVGFPSLCVHVPVGSHADMVSRAAWFPGPWWGAGAGRGGIPKLPNPSNFCLRPDGLMYQKFRNQFLSFSMYQSECLRGPCSARGWGPGKDLGLQPSPDVLQPPRLCAVPAVLLPEWLSVPPAGPGREAHHGPHRG